MAGSPQHARVVIIGAGIVGNSMAYHLARLGWRDLLLLDKGPLPNPDVAYPVPAEPAAFVCEGDACSSPVRSPERLAALLRPARRE